MTTTAHAIKPDTIASSPSVVLSSSVPASSTPLPIAKTTVQQSAEPQKPQTTQAKKKKSTSSSTKPKKARKTQECPLFLRSKLLKTLVHIFCHLPSGGRAYPGMFATAFYAGVSNRYRRDSPTFS